MNQSPEELRTLAQTTADTLTTGAWPAFLRTAAWNYKYDFPSQLLIFAQKPEATACADYAIWTSNQFGRLPDPDKFIALVAKNGPNSVVRRVFDISDTTPQKCVNEPKNPVWRVTPENEPVIRMALASAFLPCEQQTTAHVSSGATDFYRSIARALTDEQYPPHLDALSAIQHTCDLAATPEFDTEKLFRNLLTESISAMLQHRAGHNPQVNEEMLAQVKLFNSPRAISTLGHAVQEIAKTGLLEMSHAVRAWDRERNRPHIPGIPHKEGETPTICEEDVLRALRIGPALEGGKYRIYAAATNPNMTSEQFETTLREEYGTGEVPFLPKCGIQKTLSWGVQGLKFARIEPSECADLTLSWKTVSKAIKWLVEANDYLSDIEKAHMTTWTREQSAKSQRQKTSAVLSGLLDTLLPSRTNRVQEQELIRAYVYDNNQSARNALCAKLQKLKTVSAERTDSTVQTLLHQLEQELNNTKPGEGSGHKHRTAPSTGPEPLIDHPELCSKKQPQTTLDTKAALTELLYHYVTYRYVFKEHSPTLCAHDEQCRTQEMCEMDDILVSSSETENRENLQKAMTFLTRWFLPFEGIQPEILSEQENLLNAARQTLSNTSEQAQEHTHNYKHNYNYIYNQSIAPVSVAHFQNSISNDSEPQTTKSKEPRLKDKIQDAQKRIDNQAPPSISSPEPVLQP